MCYALLKRPLLVRVRNQIVNSGTLPTRIPHGFFGASVLLLAEK
jgi:hypothetical protein